MLYPDLDGQLDLEAELQHALARTEGLPGGRDRLRGEARAGLPGAPESRHRARSGAPSRSRGYDPAALPAGMPRRLLWPPSVRSFSRPWSAAPSALADAFTPESGGSPNADDIDTLYKITLYIGIVIFLLVEGTLIWSLVKYRARRGGPRPQQIRGNTPLEIGWTVGAALDPGGPHRRHLPLPRRHREPARLAARTGCSAAARPVRLDRPAGAARSGGPASRSSVNGQQYIWRYDYPGAQQLFTYHEMVVPTDTTVVLKITSSDVIHSWWIPKLGGKADAVPGYMNETWFKIPPTGRASTAASAPSCAARTTPTCARRCAPCRRTSSRRGPTAASARRSRRPARRWPRRASSAEAEPGT